MLLYLGHVGSIVILKLESDRQPYSMSCTDIVGVRLCDKMSQASYACDWFKSRKGRLNATDVFTLVPPVAPG
jgi:hypothetical protein